MWLGLVCCIRLIQILITVCSTSFHLLLIELDSHAAAAAHPLGFVVLRCRSPNLPGLFCWLRFECGMTFPTLCLTPGRRMGSRVQLTVGCFLELCFLPFSLAQVLVKQFINNLILPTLACAVGFNKNIDLTRRQRNMWMYPSLL